LTFGEALMRWSVRLSVALMFAAWLLMLHRRRSPREPTIRRVWTAAYASFLVHVWAAFEFVHHWSHTAAVHDTARQTRKLVGVDWGGGVWANYLFAIIWGADVLWRWLAPSDRRRRPWIVGALFHGFLGFIAFNATVVFATGFSRWLGVVGIALLILQWRGRHDQETTAPTSLVR
jgi:hypothetical protein